MVGCISISDKARPYRIVSPSPSSSHLHSKCVCLPGCMLIKRCLVLYQYLGCGILYRSIQGQGQIDSLSYNLKLLFIGSITFNTDSTMKFLGSSHGHTTDKDRTLLWRVGRTHIERLGRISISNSIRGGCSSILNCVTGDARTHIGRKSIQHGCCV